MKLFIDNLERENKKFVKKEEDNLNNFLNYYREITAREISEREIRLTQVHLLKRILDKSERTQRNSTILVYIHILYIITGILTGLIIGGAL